MEQKKQEIHIAPGVSALQSQKCVACGLQGVGHLETSYLLVTNTQYNLCLVIPIGEESRQIHVGYVEDRGRQAVSTRFEGAMARNAVRLQGFWTLLTWRENSVQCCTNIRIHTASKLFHTGDLKPHLSHFLFQNGFCLQWRFKGHGGGCYCTDCHIPWNDNWVWAYRQAFNYRWI